MSCIELLFNGLIMPGIVLFGGNLFAFGGAPVTAAADDCRVLANCWDCGAIGVDVTGTLVCIVVI